MVVWAQRGGVLFDDTDSGDHVLLSAEGGGAAGVFISAVDCALLVAGIHLHLGGAAPFAEHGVADVATVFGDVLQFDAVGAELGWDAQWVADAAWSLGQVADGSGGEVLYCGGDVLRDVDL